jgi:phosphatidylinositol alpha-1,6-mannosyltransferase
MRIAVLLSDAFGALGGIAKFNRDFLRALDKSALVGRIYAWPRVIEGEIHDIIPESIIYERKFSRGKLAYGVNILGKLLFGPTVSLVICAHINLLPLAWLIARSRGARLALIIYGIDAWKPTRNWLTNWMAGRVDFLFTISAISAERFAKWSKFPRDRMSILPPCVDLTAFTPGEKPADLQAKYDTLNSRVLMTLGRLVSEDRFKGFDQVLEVMPTLLQEFPDLIYLIVGDGPDMARLVGKASALGITNNVVFAGKVLESEKQDHYRLADVFVMPSFGEGFGIVLIEAAACGIPVVGSEADGSKEALLEGRLGRLVNPFSPADIVTAVAGELRRPGPRVRNPLVEYFSASEFDKRVDELVCAPAAER